LDLSPQEENKEKKGKFNMAKKKGDSRFSLSGEILESR